MADTGAPWNLPYPLPTDLVRDGADAIKDLAEAAAAGLDLAGNPGIGSNVVQTVKTNVFTTTSTSFTNVDGLSVTITPSTATSKILLVAQVNATNDSATGSQRLTAIRFSGGNTAGYVGDAGASNTQAVAAMGTFSDALLRFQTPSLVMVYLDSPATDDPVTYTVQILASASTARVNGTDTTGVEYPRTASSITAIEVAA